MVIANHVEELLKFCLDHKTDIVCAGELASTIKLDFAGKDLGDKGAVSLAHALRSMKQLEWLSLASNRIGEDGASALRLALAGLTELKYLDMGQYYRNNSYNMRNKIGARGARALAPALEKLGSLEHLDLSYNDLKAEGALAFAPALEKMGSLQHLDISSNGLEAEGAWALATALEKMSSLQHLDLRLNGLRAGGGLALAPALEKMGSLQHLDLWSNGLKAEGVLALVPALEKMSTLQHLDLSDNILKIKGALVLAPALEKMSSLQHLDLSDNFLKVKGALALAPTLEKMGSLQHLDFSDNILKVEGALALAPALEKMGSLQHLNLSGNMFRAEGALALAPALEKMDSLQHLDLSDNILKVGGTLALAPALEKLGSLQLLNLGYSDLNAEAALALAPVFLKISSLEKLTLGVDRVERAFLNCISCLYRASTELNLSQCSLNATNILYFIPALEKMGSLQHLDLSFNVLNAEGALALAPALEKMGSLQHLDLRRNNLKAGGALALKPALEKMCSLQYLNLSFNVIKAEGALALAMALEKMDSLQHLNIRGNSVGPEGVRALVPSLLKIPSLKNLTLGEKLEKAVLRVLLLEYCSELDLRDCGLDATNIHFFTPFLENMGSLQHLNLGWNKLNPEGARALAPALEKMGSLQHLNLRGNAVGPEGVRALATALEKLGSLRHLNLSDNFLKAEGALAFAPALEKMGSLQHLNLDYNEIGPVGMRALALALGKMSSLQHLDFSCNDVLANDSEFLNLLYPTVKAGILVSPRTLAFPQWGFSRIPNAIFNFIGLESLIISSNRGVFSSTSILKNDDKYGNRNCVESLPPDIGKLTSLRRLEVAGGNIQSLPSSIADLRRISYLDLRLNPLDGLPDGRGILIENCTLDLDNRRMTETPKWLWRLHWIRSLCLSRNPLLATASFTKLSRFENLESLNLSWIGLTRISHLSLSSLPLLSSLDISGNLLSTFPSEISHVPSLSSLNISNNPISAIPPEFVLCSTSMKALTLLPNVTLTSPPPPIAKQGLSGIRSYFEELQKGSHSLVHMKLLLLGDAEMGKTTLFEALTTGKGKAGWRPRTFGIDVRFWDIAHLRQSTSGFFSVWDFAGQEDYVAAHSLFVGEAVVLLVVRLDAEPPFMKYLARWLDSLAASVKSKTPFMVIGTHADRLWPSQKDAALHRLRAELFAHGYEIGGDLQGNLELLDVFALSSTKARGIPDLRNRLVDLASERYCELYPSSYWDLHAAVRNASMHRPIVKWSQFWQQSQLLRATAATEETVLQMTKVLHEWGSVLFFEEMEERYVVLNPQWLAKCVAKVVSADEFVNAEGILEIHRWLQDGPRPAHFLLSLLQRFGIVCALNMESCLVPCRLKSTRPNDFQVRWPAEVPLGLESRRLFFRFERAAPRGFFSHLMARCLSRPEHYDSIYWDRGLVVRDASSGCMACVLSEPFQVVLKVRGCGDSVEEFLRWLVSTTELLHKEVFPMTIASWISPCCCSNCGTKEVPSCTWPLEELERRAEDGEVSVSHGDEQMLLISLGVRAQWKPEVQTSPVPVIAPSSLFQHLITDEWEWNGVKVNVILLPISDGLLGKVKALWERSEVGENVAVPSAICLRPPCLVFPPWPEKEVTDQEIQYENGLVLSLTNFNSQ